MMGRPRDNKLGPKTLGPQKKSAQSKSDPGPQSEQDFSGPLSERWTERHARNGPRHGGFALFLLLISTANSLL
jgi:hypothetical protein